MGRVLKSAYSWWLKLRTWRQACVVDVGSCGGGFGELQQRVVVVVAGPVVLRMGNDLVHVVEDLPIA